MTGFRRATVKNKGKERMGHYGRPFMKKMRISSHPIRYLFVILAALSLLILLRYGLHWFGREFLPVKQVLFTGYKHLSEKELMRLSAINNTDMINLSAKSVKANLMKSPWIKNVSIRKDFPDTVKIMIYETEPFALLEMKGKSFLIDGDGRLLEELKGEAIPFLPVILSDPFKNRESFTEAIILARVLRERNIAKERNRVEILADREKENMAVMIDGVVVKVGYGDYEEKFARLFELEEEIKKKAMAVEYIDLRFSNSVIVKPVKEIVK